MQTWLGLISRRSVLVLVASGLVYVAMADGAAHAQGRNKSKSGSTTPARDPAALPSGVTEMIGLIQDAIHSGRIEALRDAVDWNEMKPDFGVPGLIDPVAHWTAQSADGSGRETLNLLATLLEGPPAVVPYGKDIENNRLFVWPRFAEGRLDALSSEERLRFDRLVPEAAREAMRATGRYRGWRLVLGADGTWHTFRKDE